RSRRRARRPDHRALAGTCAVALRSRQTMAPTETRTMTDESRIHVTADALIALRQRVMHAPPRRPMHAPVPGGPHATARRGRGMDYLESRAYQPGDDVRHLDWRLTARSGRLHTKVFQEEGEQRVMLLLDSRASMRFGTRERFKSVQAARAMALAAWHVAQAGGQV